MAWNVLANLLFRLHFLQCVFALAYLPFIPSICTGMTCSGADFKWQFYEVV